MHRPTLQDAIDLARRAHEGQFDKAGNPYFSHAERVMNGVAGEDLKIIAVLHDTVEDTDETSPVHVTFDYLRAAGYPEPIVEAIDSLTKRPDEEGGKKAYMRFVARAAQNPLAREVKKSDLRDNMNLNRIAEPTEKDLKRLKRYQKALTFLEGLSE